MPMTSMIPIKIKNIPNIDTIIVRVVNGYTSIVIPKIIGNITDMINEIKPLCVFLYTLNAENALTVPSKINNVPATAGNMLVTTAVLKYAYAPDTIISTAMITFIVVPSLRKYPYIKYMAYIIAKIASESINNVAVMAGYTIINNPAKTYTIDPKIDGVQNSILLIIFFSP